MKDESSEGCFRFRPRVIELDGARGRLELFECLSRLRERRRPCLLDSASGVPRRFSLLAFDPLPPAPPPISSGGGPRVAALRAFLGRLRFEEGDPLPPWFRGGFLGALAYDLGVEGEPLALPDEPFGFPLVVGGLYTDFLVRDEQAARTWLVLGEEPGDGREVVDERRERVLAALEHPWPTPRGLRPRGPLTRCVEAAEQCARVERARAAIAAGEIYQANLAYRSTRLVEGDPVELYARLRRLHPGPYLGFLGWEGGALLSGSPELLLQVERDEDGLRALTRPIKGTSRRGDTAEQDRASAAGLLASAKDLAELTMIVDLERNDLGRVALPGSVVVGDFPRLESYATVHHLVADVSARLADGLDGLDVLGSLFPGGSITGAPKLRSMEVIADLEQEGRGFSYGSLVLADTAGTVLANILIRTLLWRARAELGENVAEVSYRVGGGITWGSDALAEDQESLAKGEALARTLEGEA